MFKTWLTVDRMFGRRLWIGTSPIFNTFSQAYMISENRFCHALDTILLSYVKTDLDSSIINQCIEVNIKITKLPPLADKD